jgi:hypothetical protein
MSNQILSFTADDLLRDITPASDRVGKFVADYLPVAQRAAARLGVEPEVLLGQWGLETGWGKSVIPGTNNLGNIKDFSGGGEAAKDNQTGTTDKYRRYGSPEVFADDFAGLVARRFRSAAGAGGDAQRYFAGLQSSPTGAYAEDREYVSKGVSAARMAREAMGKPNTDAGAARDESRHIFIGGKPARSRGAFEAVNDTVIEGANAVLGGVKAVGDFVAPGNAVSRGAQALIDEGQSRQSNVVRDERARLQEDLALAETAGEEITTVLGYMARNPVLTAAQMAGMLAVPGAAIKGARGAAQILGAGARGTAVAGTAAGVGAGAMLGGGDAAGTAYELVAKSPDDVIAKSPEAQALAAQGLTMAQIKHELGTRAAREASALPALLGAAGGAVGAERILAAGGKAASGPRRVLATGAIEGTTEGAEEAATQFSGQKAAQQYNPEIDPTKGVAAAGAQGAVMGAGTGAAVAALAPELPVVPPEVAAKAAEPNSPLSKAAASGATAQQNLQTAQQQNLQAAQARLADLDRKASGTPGEAVTLPDGSRRETQGAPGLFLTDAERSEREQLRAMLTPAQTPEQQAQAEQQAGQAAAANDVATVDAGLQAARERIRSGSLFDVLRAEGSPYSASKIASDLAIAGSKNTPIHTREQALGRIQGAIQWAEDSVGRPGLGAAQELPATTALPPVAEDRSPAPAPTVAEARDIAQTPGFLRSAEDRIAIDAARRDVGDNDLATRAIEQPWSLTAEERVRLAGRGREEAATVTAVDLPSEDRAQISDTLPQTPQDSERSVRRAHYDDLAELGFETIERNEDGSYTLRNARTKQSVPVRTAADAQLARAAIKARFDRAAARAARDPSPAQIEAENWRKGEKRQLNGVTVTIENERGSTRRSKPGAKVQWESTMVHHYGDIDGYIGADGDEVDVFVGQRPDSPRIFVVDQRNRDGKFDEHKVMFGFTSEQDARAGYLSNYEPGWTGLGAITEMSQAEFKAWLKGDLKKPASPGFGDNPVTDDRSNAAVPGARPQDAGAGARPSDDGRGVADGTAGGGRGGERAGGGDRADGRDDSRAPAQSTGRRGETDPGRAAPEEDAVEVRLSKDGPLTRIALLARAPSAKHRLLERIAERLGRRVRFYKARDAAGRADGFTKIDDPSTIYLAADSKVNPLQVLLHEFWHTIERTQPDVADIIKQALRGRVGGKQWLTFRSYYNVDGIADDALFEELRADLAGLSMADPTFWADVFDEIEREQGEKAPGIIARILGLLEHLLDSMNAAIVAFRDQDGFETHAYVDDMKAVRAAYKQALKQYLQDSDTTQQAMGADILRAKKSAERAATKSAPRDVTQTEAFKRWFGDSKVVDAQGKPLVVYHGTNADITTFDPDKSPIGNRGIYFASDKFLAGAYASRTAGNAIDDPAPVMYPVYLSIQNPLVLDGSRFDPTTLKGRIARLLFPKRVAEEIAKNKLIDGLTDEDGGRLFSQRDVEQLRAAGYDGVITLNAYKPAGTAQVAVVFEPSQIKSAIGNDGNFDPQSADITRSPERQVDAAPARAQTAAREEDTAGRLGRDAGEDRGREAADLPRYGTPVAGAVSAVGRHYSDAKRTTLSSAAFGRGLKGAERARLDGLPAGSPLRQRISFYIDLGNGVRPEAGVGAYAHEVRLDNLYDADSGKITGRDHNEFERKVVEAGYDGYMTRRFTTQQGAAVLLGKHDVPVKPIGKPPAAAAPREEPPQEIRYALSSREIDAIDVSKIPGATLRSGTLRFPTASRDAAAAEMERIGGDATFSRERAVTKTAAFKKWFGDSKVVDADGKPLVVYHGTTSDFEQFDPSETFDGGLYFTNNAEHADEYAAIKGGQEGIRILPVYLSLKNPKIIDAMQQEIGNQFNADWQQFLQLEIENAAWRKSHDGLIVKNLDALGYGADSILYIAFRPEQIKSAIGNTAFDADDADITKSAERQSAKHVQRAAELLEEIDPPRRSAVAIMRDEIDAPTFDNLFELSRWFTRRNRRGAEDMGDAAVKRRMLDALYADTLLALTDPKSGVGWYDEKVRAALGIMAEAHPEIATDEQARFGFIALLAITSNQTRVNENFEIADALYSQWKRTGEFPVDVSAVRATKAQTEMSRSLAKLRELIDEHGWRKVRDFMVTKQRPAAIEKFTGYKVTGENVDAEVYGATAFGPKLGAFFNNLYGNFDTVTMDRWWMRTVNRIRGSMLSLPNSFGTLVDKLDAQIAAGVDTLGVDAKAMRREIATWKRLSDADQADVLVALEQMPTVVEYTKKRHKHFAKSSGPGRGSFGERTAENYLAKNLDLALRGDEQAPRNGGDRLLMRELVFKLQQRLKDAGIDMVIADIQAALWYYEKALVAKLRGKASSQEQLFEDQDDGIAEDYETAARRVLARRGEPGPAERRAGAARRDAGVAERAAAGADRQVALFSAGRGDGGRRDSGRVDAAREGAPADGRAAPLQGYAVSRGVGSAWGPDPRIAALAERYARDNGIDYRRQAEYVAVDEERAKRIADAYEAMAHAPGDARVKAAYADLIRQTRAQYDALVADGYEFTFFDAKSDPYAGNPWAAMRDLRDNRRMAVYGTYDGYGTDGITGAQVDGNPMLADTGLRWKDQGGAEHPVVANDLFRAVHDAFGHGLEGAGFRADGEENAWNAHVRLFTGDAVGAITTETRGQNSWLNFGPHGERNRTASLEDTVFAEQRTGLMPEWTWSEGRAGDAPSSAPQGGQDALKSAERRTYERPVRRALNATELRDARKHLDRKFAINSVDEIVAAEAAEAARLQRELGLSRTEALKAAADILRNRNNGDVSQSAERKQRDLFPGEFASKRSSVQTRRVVSSRGETSRGGNVNSAGQRIAATRQGLENFWSWFGDSEMVDDSGRPSVYYHGTRGDFREFEVGRPTKNSGTFGDWETTRAALFFAAEPGEAEAYATDGDGKPRDGANVMPVYLRAENVLDIGGGYTRNDDLRRLEEAGLNPRYMNNFDWSKFDDGDGAEFVAAAKLAGYDAVRFWDESPTPEKPRAFMAVAVFDRSQVKSAIGNDGHFDPSSPDITKSSARWTPKRIDGLLNAYAYTQGDGSRTKAYAAWVSPADFLAATTPSDERGRLEGEREPLDTAQLAEQRQEVYLLGDIDRERGWFRIKGHEGRHRMMALRDAGVTSVPVVFNTNEGHDAEPMTGMFAVAQQWVDKRAERGFLIGRMVPVSHKHVAELNERFGPNAEMDKLRQQAGMSEEVRFSTERDDDAARKRASEDEELDRFRQFAGDVRAKVSASLEYGQMLARQHEWAHNVGDVLLSTHTGKTYRLVGRTFSRVGKIKDNNWQPIYAYESGNPPPRGAKPSEIEAWPHDYQRGTFTEKAILESKTLKSLVTPRFSSERVESAHAGWQTPSASSFDDLVYKMQDKHIDTKRVVDAVREADSALRDDLDVYLQEELFHGRAAKRTEDFVHKELKPLTDAMAERGLTLAELDEYLHARHAKEANAVIRERNPEMEDGGSGMTDADADAYFAELTADKREHLAAAAEKVDAILKRTRKLLVEYQLESRDKVRGWGEMFEHYVPLMRDEEGAPHSGNGTGQGFSIKGKEVKSRTGSKRRVVDILANIAMQRERVIVRGEKNRVGQALVGLAVANPNKEFWSVNDVPSQQVFNEKTGLVETRYDTQYKNNPNVVTAKFADEDGSVREHAVVFNERDERALRMAGALKNLDASQLEGLLGLSATATRYFASVNTQYNPVFGIVNLVRDVQAALVNLQSTELAGKQGEIARGTLGAIRGIYGDARKARKGEEGASEWAALWEDFTKAGGQTGYRDIFATSADRAAAIEKALNPDAWTDSKLGRIFTANGALKVPMAAAMRAARWIFDWLSDYNLAMENGVRLSSYKAALDAGMSRERAASLAKNLTVNFNRKGQVAQQAGALYAFFNASMQGTARLAGTLLEQAEPGKFKSTRLTPLGKKVVAGGMLLGAVQALALAAAGFDEEDPPQWQRERNLIIPLGGKKFASIPMPLGLHVIPNVGRVTTEWVLSGFKDTPKRALSLVTSFAEAFNPIGNAGMSIQTIAPTVIDPLVALTENRDWSGRPIYRESSNKATPGHALARDTATVWSRAISEAINVASGGNRHVAGALSPTPDAIDYLIGQVTGGVGREISKVTQTASAAMTGETLPLYKVPLVGRLIGDAKSQASEGSAFYANLERLNKIETEIKGLRKEGDAAAANAIRMSNPEAYLITQANHAERAVQKLRREKREAVAAGASREQVKAIEERITARMAALNRAVEGLRERE